VESILLEQAINSVPMTISKPPRNPVTMIPRPEIPAFIAISSTFYFAVPMRIGA
jgi:hypothetical protein